MVDGWRGGTSRVVDAPLLLSGDQEELLVGAATEHAEEPTMVGAKAEEVTLDSESAGSEAPDTDRPSGGKQADWLAGAAADMMLCSKDSSKGSWSAGLMLVPFPTCIGFDLKRLWSDDLHLISISFDFMLEMEEDSQSEYKAHCSL